MNHALAGLTCAVALVVSLAASGGGDDKAALPTCTGASATSTSQPTITPPTPVPGATGPDALAASSTYTYGGLKVVVNLPTDIPSASRPSLRLFLDFLQARPLGGLARELDLLGVELGRSAACVVQVDAAGAR